MIKTLGFGMSALAGPALLTGAILYASAPEAEAPMSEPGLQVSEQDGAASREMHKDYGVVWTKL